MNPPSDWAPVRDFYASLLRWTAIRPYLKPHHDLGPSRLRSLSLCPASYKESIGLERDSPEAKWGQDMHAATFGDPSTPRDLSDFDLSMVAKARAWIDQWTEGADDVRLEVPVMLEDSSTGAVINYGTLDAIAVWFDQRRAVVGDLKFYRTPVSEDALLLQTANYSAPFLRVFDEVETIGYNPITSTEWKTTYKSGDFESIVSSVDNIIRTAREPDPEYHPSVDACAFCAALGHCKAVREKLPELADSVGVTVAAVAGTTKDERKDLIRARLATHSEAEILDRLEDATLAIDVGEAIRDVGKEILKRGEVTHADWEVNERAGNRKIEDVAAARKAVCIPGGVTPESFDECCSVAVGKLESAWKKAAGTTLDQQASHVVSRGEPTYVLKRKTTKRKAIK